MSNSLFTIASLGTPLHDNFMRSQKQLFIVKCLVWVVYEAKYLPLVFPVKEKTEILLELDELKSVRDELTEEVTSLTSELEKERSKVHALKSEVEKDHKAKVSPLRQDSHYACYGLHRSLSFIEILHLALVLAKL